MNYSFSVGGCRPFFTSRLQHAWKHSMRKLASFLLLSLALATALPAHSATVPGTTPGNFGVNESGAATYSVPIAVPPGTAGMQPKLSLTYSSHGGNGIAGVGWSIGGQSAVTRCPQTIVHDGATRGVQLDAGDRFCLDGQRLILTTGASYGAVGAEYRTEIESFSKIVSIGGTLGDPQSFQIWTKAGQIIDLGNTADSRVEAQGKSLAATWAVNKLSDTAGNYMTFTYFEDTVNGEHRITRVDYTGNVVGDLAPYNAVVFEYEARPDAEVEYVKGSKSQTSQRLSKILTYEANNVVKDYGLEYETGAATGKTRLISVTECAGNGDCLNPTTFVWQEGEVGLAPTAENTGVADTNALYTRAIDANGDGITDLVYPSGATWKVRFSLEGGFSSEIDTGIASTGYQYARPVDFNADGRIDMLVPYANGRWYLMRATGNPATPFDPPFDTGIVDGGKGANPQLVDINGDGYPDMVHAHDSYWYSTLGNGAGFGVDTRSNMPYVQNGSGYYAFDWGRPVDFQGDGLADVQIPRLYQRYLCGGFSICEDVRWDVITRPGTGPLTVVPTNIAAFLYSGVAGTGVIYIQKSQQAIDINRDGNTDLLTMGTNGAGGAAWWLCQNWGGDLGHCTNTTFAAPSGGQVMIQTDWNGDGKPDMLVAANGGAGNWTVYQTNNNGLDMAQLNSGISQQGYNSNPLIGDFNGDGLLDLVLAYGGAWNLRLHNGLQPDLLVSITDGMGATRAISYKPLTDNTVYTKGSGAVFPQADIQDTTYVVAETTADNGIGGQFANAYRYEGGRAHLNGRGFLGFRMLEQTDLQSGIKTRSEFSQAFPDIGTPLLITKTSPGGIELSRVENTPASKTLNAGKTFFPYIAYSKEQGKDLNGTLLPSTETWNTYGDEWGNLTQVVTQTSDGFKKQTDSTYTNDAANWFLGRLTRASATSTVNGWTLARVSAFEYDATTGLLNKETIEPDRPQLRLDTAYAFDAFGNRKTVTVRSPATGVAAIVPRSTTTTYDTKGQFPVTVANALGHTESRYFDARFGTVATLTGPNNLTTTWQYDGFGRKKTETRADGTRTVWTHAACDAACPAYGIYRVVTQVFAPAGVQSAPVSVAYFDRLDRQLRTATQSFDGRWVYQDTQYDGQGRVAQASRPYFAGGAVYWASSNYDDLGRITQAFEPDEPAIAALTVDYNGLTVTRTNRKAQTTSETRNSQGQKVSVTDALGSVVTYAYDPFGNPLYILSPGGQDSLTLYDIRGRKTYGYSPDMGGWSYDYDALGELVKQTDAKQQITTFAYDTLGRMTRRVEPGLTSDWVWDGAYYGKGKLQSAQTSAGYVRSHYYDDKGRPILTLANSGDGTPFLWSSTAFDAAGRIYEQHYPSGVGVRHIYNALGYAAELRNTTANALYWQLNAQDAEGHITKETYGNRVVTDRGYLADNGRLQTIVANPASGAQVQGAGYFYDTLGNIWLRGDDSGAEFPTYDGLSRLTGITRYDPNGNTVETVAYDAKGNIVSKTAAGDYHYGGDPACAPGSGAGPHAVCKAGTNAYNYDANGNLIGGGGRIVGWTAWNMPASVTESGQAKLWLYGPEHDRYKMFAPGRTTWYLDPGIHQGGHYERTQYAGGTVEHRTTLYGAGRPIGEVLSFDGTAPEQTRYFHTDHQGSITVVTDSAGVVITRYKYDPWGKQTLVSGSNTGIGQTRQGHTGHEMLDGGLTHMNGRLYDPLISRFVSADPFVQEPYNLQSLNRYSYVWNNPLGYTDPTGYSAWTDFRDGFLKPVVAIAVAWYVGPAVSNTMLPSAVGAAGATGLGMQASLWAGTAMAGAASGAVVGGITGGIFNGPEGIVQGAKYGAIGGAVTGPFAAAYGGINGQGGSPWNFERVAVNSLAGGVSSVGQGGSFADGFRSSGISSAFRYVYNSVVKYDVDPGAGGDAVRKEEFDMPIKGANNFGTAGELNPESWFGEGGVLSRAANQIPSINAISGLHDVFQVRLQEWGGVFARNALNVPGMLPAAGITWMGLRDTPYLSYDTIQRTERRAR